MGTFLAVHNITNTNTGFALVNIPSQQYLEVVEFGEHGIYLQVPVLHFKAGTLVSLEISLPLQQQRIPLSVTGKILAVESKENPEDLGRVQIQLHQIDKNIWSQFLTQASENQDRVDELLRAIKGFG